MDSPQPGDAFIHRLDLAPTASGSLDGLAFAVKDVIDIADTVTGCGNPTWAATHFAADRHAVIVELLLNSGARCLGKTITDEFAFSLVGENHFYGTPANARAPERIPGGSSAGSASAVAGKEVDFALGTDTAGSIRVPGTNCGLYGLRPTWGRIPMAGVQALAPSFDTLGILTRDSATLKQVIQCLWPTVPSSPIETVFILEEAWALADSTIQALLPHLIERMKRAGLKVEMLRLPSIIEGELGTDIFSWKRTFSAVQWPEVWSTFGGWLRHAQPELGPRIAENFALTQTYDRSRLMEAFHIRESARRSLHAFLQPSISLCVPTTSSPPPLRGKVDYDRTGTGYLARTLCLTAFAGIGGLPQIAVPISTEENLPAGFSLIGAPNADLALISAVQKL